MAKIIVSEFVTLASGYPASTPAYELLDLILAMPVGAARQTIEARRIHAMQRRVGERQSVRRK